MTPERMAEARASICGWKGCPDCVFLAEALDEIERLHEVEIAAWLARPTTDIVGCLIGAVLVGICWGLVAGAAVLALRLFP